MTAIRKNWQPRSSASEFLGILHSHSKNLTQHTVEYEFILKFVRIRGVGQLGRGQAQLTNKKLQMQYNE